MADFQIYEGKIVSKTTELIQTITPTIIGEAPGFGFQLWKQHEKKLVDIINSYNGDKKEEIKNNLTTFVDVLSFICLCIEIVSLLNKLGLTGDIKEQNIQEQSIRIVRDFYKDEFPPEKYAYAPIKSETKEITYSGNEIIANNIITYLFDAGLIRNFNGDDVIYEIQATISDYEIYPPVAILRNESEFVYRDVLIAPNMDNSWISVTKHSKYLYYPLNSFQSNMLLHSLAYYFIKNHSYGSAIVFTTLSSSRPFIINIIKDLGLDNKLEDALILTFEQLFEVSKYVSHILSGVSSSIVNVTGLTGKGDAYTTIRLLAAQVKETKILQTFTNNKTRYEQTQATIPKGTIKNLLLSASYTNYTPQGDYTIVTTNRTSITAHGQRCSNTTTHKISRNSVIQVIPLLRSKIIYDCSGNMVLIENSREKGAKIIGSKLSFDPTKEKFNIGVPTTDWETVKNLASVCSDKIVTKTISGKFCCNSIDDIRYVISISDNVSVNWDTTNNYATARITSRWID